MSHPLLRDVSSSVALIEGGSGRSVTHAELSALVAQMTATLSAARGAIIFLAAGSTIDSVVRYLSLTGCGATVALLDPATKPEILRDWVDAYLPDGVFGFGASDQDLVERPAGSEARRGAEAILLPTSGSTGNPKFVRLSMHNVVSNATQIAQALRISSDDRALAHLPLFYSFGLSVLNSHLVRGASVVLTDASAIRPEFWDAMRTFEVSSLPGVPYSFEMFRRMQLTGMDLPHLRDVTQAGGRLNVERIREFSEGLGATRVRLWIMYGQTEATARISVLPAEELASSIGSVGYPLPGGSLTIAGPDANGEGEVVYTGPNVMLGYASSRADVDGSDRLGGTLATGDIGRLDDAGRLWITGRSKRIAKVFGTRINLDDVERRLGELGHPVAATSGDDGIIVHVESAIPIGGFARSCERLLGLPPRSVRAFEIEHLPTTAAGKIDYRGLESHE